MPDFVVFARYFSSQEAEPLLLLLESNNISFELGHESNQIEVIVGGGLEPMYTVAVPADRFMHIHTLVAASLTSTESVKAQPDGGDLLSEYLPPRLSLPWIICGYMLSCFPVMGIFISLTLTRATKRINNGDSVPLYDHFTMRHGRIMLFIGIAFTCWFLWKKIL